MIGRVKWWSVEKGYGFIEYNDDENIFAYLEESDKNTNIIHENQEIEFIIEERDNIHFLKLLAQCEN